jgi:succinate dehydrogenase/fumarate reductase-like Fe-S protein
MHAFSSSIDAPQLLHLMAAGDESSSTKLSDLHQQACKLVQQLEQQLEQHVTEPVVAQWLRASAYDTYALMLRAGEFLAGVKDVQAAKRLAELVRVSACQSCGCCGNCKNVCVAVAVVTSYLRFK